MRERERDRERERELTFKYQIECIYPHVGPTGISQMRSTRRRVDFLYVAWFCQTDILEDRYSMLLFEGLKSTLKTAEF